MVAFDTTRPTKVSGGRNEGMNFGNIGVWTRERGGGDHGGGRGTGRKVYCWICGGGYMNRDFLKRAEDKENKKNDG